jgi:hypothetical protein
VLNGRNVIGGPAPPSAAPYRAVISRRGIAIVCRGRALYESGEDPLVPVVDDLGVALLLADI